MLDNISNNRNFDNGNESFYFSSIGTGNMRIFFHEIFKKLDNEFNKNKSLQNNNVPSDEMRERPIYQMEHNPFIFESLYFIIVQTKIQLYSLT